MFMTDILPCDDKGHAIRQCSMCLVFFVHFMYSFLFVSSVRCRFGLNLVQWEAQSCPPPSCCDTCSHSFLTLD